MVYRLSACLALLIVGVIAIRTLVSRRKSFLRNLQGPKSQSFWLGNERDLSYQNEVGDIELKWMRSYGSVWRRTACLGEDHLMVADPKALQYILHGSGYHFPKRADVVQFYKMIAGRGLLWAHGKVHQRQRRILNPAFSAPQIKSLLPVFQNVASKLVQKWKDEVIPSDPSGTPMVNVCPWLNRTTLDIIGEAGFDFQFGSLDNAQAPLVQLFESWVTLHTLYPSELGLVFKSTWKYLPEWLLDLFWYLPRHELRQSRLFLEFLRGLSRTIVEKGMIKNEGNDMMSALLRANGSKDHNSTMSIDEVVDQIAILLITGHHTVAGSTIWFLWEIAKHPEDQERIRSEIASARAKNVSGGDLTVADLESMVFTTAAIQESLRLHPLFWMLAREAERDDVIPLAFPVTTKSGEQISAIPVQKGTHVDIAIDVYHRLPAVWGEDADQWNPQRFLDPERTKQATVGAYSNLLNFSGGIRGCIGWRFSVLEMQVIATSLLENFEISLPPQNEQTRVFRKPGGTMAPMMNGVEGAWMGLVIKPLR
ncbi:cytochrome P450 [Gloeopeniophorella convolvens]|nr:cytochrome P450 [Gloeopeniophorella convolvens]